MLRADLEKAIKELNEELALIRAAIDKDIERANKAGAVLSSDAITKDRFPQGLKAQSDALTAIKAKLTDFPTPTEDDLKTQDAVDALAKKLRAHAEAVKLEEAKTTLASINSVVATAINNYKSVFAAALQKAEEEAAAKAAAIAAERAKGSPEAAEAIRTQHRLDSFLLLTELQALMANKNIDAIEGTGPLKAALDAAGTELLNYLTANEKLDLTDATVRKTFAETAPGEIERLQKNLKEAIAKVNEAIVKDQADKKAAVGDADTALKTETTSCQTAISEAEKILKPDATVDAIAGMAGLKKILSEEKDKLDKALKSPPAIDLTAANAKELLLAEKDKLARLRANLEHIHKAVTDAIKVEDDKNVKTAKDNLRTKIQTAIDLYETLDTELKDASKFDPALLPKITAQITAAKTARKALNDILVDLSAPSSPKSLNALDKFYSDHKIAEKINTLSLAISAVRSSYVAAKTADDKAKTDAAAAAAVAAGDKLQLDKDTLSASITSVIDANSAASKLLATIAGTKEKNLEPHEKAISALIKDLTKLQGDIPSATQNGLDNPPEDLKKNVAAKIDALKIAVAAAHQVADPIRAQHVKAKFNRYKERVSLIEGLLDVVAHPDKASKYTNTLAEVDRIREDLAIYEKWIRVTDQSAADEAQKLINKLNKIMDELKLAALPADYGIRYFGKESEKVEGKNEDEFKKAIDAVKAKYRADYGANPASTRKGTIASKNVAFDDPSRFTPGFKGLEDESVTGKFVGRVTLNKTESSNTILKKTPIVSITTQRIKDGARVSEIEFLDSGFDDSKSMHIHFGSNPSRLPNDRVLKHAIKDVLNHLLADKSPELRSRLIDDMTNELLKGQIPAALKQMATTPIYITGNLHDNYAEAVMLFCNYINLECHDTRSGKDCKIIKEVKNDHAVSYRKSITKDPDRYFGAAKPIMTPTAEIQALNVDTTPKLK